MEATSSDPAPRSASFQAMAVSARFGDQGAHVVTPAEADRRRLSGFLSGALCHGHRETAGNENKLPVGFRRSDSPGRCQKR